MLATVAILVVTQPGKRCGSEFSVPLALNYSATRFTSRHSANGIDRRHGLSLQEFFDVYDAKW
jgi:hypothetical protein